jgi:hypothetical protein
MPLLPVSARFSDGPDPAPTASAGLACFLLFPSPDGGKTTMAAAFRTDDFAGWEPIPLEIPTLDFVELGSLVAALAEETEDEFELDLRVRAFVESGCVHVLQRITAAPADALRDGSRLEN